MAPVESNQVSGNVAQPIPFPAGVIVRRAVDFEITAVQAGTAGLIIQMLPIFAKERVVDLFLLADDCDSGIAAIVLDVGDALVVDRYIDGSTQAGTGGGHRMLHAPAAAPSATEFPFTYTANDTIDIKVAVAAATGVAGTLRLIALITAG